MRALVVAEFAYFIYDAIYFVETFTRFDDVEVLTASFNLHHGYAPGLTCRIYACRERKMVYGGGLAQNPFGRL